MRKYAGNAGVGRRLLALATAAALMLSGCGGASKAAGKPEAFMRRESLALTEQIGALAANGEYVKLMTVSGELLKETEAVGAQDFTQPTAVYRIAVTDDMLKKVVSGAGMEPLGEETLAALRSRLNAAFFANLVNGSQGAAVLAAMNVLSCGKSYQEPGNWPGDSLVILEYGNGYTGMVTFMQTGEGVISAEASLAKDGEGNATALLLQLLGVGDGALEPLAENS